RYIGEIFWISGYYKHEDADGVSKSNIKRAILKDGIFKIDHTNPNDNPDSEIKLKTSDGISFAGSFKYIDDKTFKGSVNMSLYDNPSQAILIGKWVEDGEIYTCIIELKLVKEF